MLIEKMLELPSQWSTCKNKSAGFWHFLIGIGTFTYHLHIESVTSTKY